MRSSTMSPVRQARVLGVLIRRELREQLLAFTLVLALVLVVCVILMGLHAASGSALSVLDIIPRYLMLLLPLLTLWLGHRLVLREHLEGSIVFAESLPVSAFQRVLARYLVGTVLLGVATLGVACMVFAAATPADGLHARWMLLLLLRAIAVTWCLWSLVFAVNHVGVLRIPLYVVIAYALLLVSRNPVFELDQFGPFMLADPNRFGYVREFATTAMWQTFGLILLLTVIGFVLAVFRHGRLVKRWFRPMQRHDYVFVAVLLLTVNMLDDWLRPQAPDLSPQMTRHSIANADQSVVIHAVDESGREAAEQLHVLLVDSLARLRFFLQHDLDTELHITLDPNRAFDYVAARGDAHLALQFGRATSVPAGSTGVDVDSPGQPPGVTRYDLWNWHSMAIRVLLLHSSNWRAGEESRAWLLDGFGWWWSLQQSPQLQENLQPVLAMMQAVQNDVQPRLPGHWLPATHWSSVLETAGDFGAGVLAYGVYSQLQQMATAEGDSARHSQQWQNLLRAYLADPVAMDSRVVWNDWREPLEQQIERLLPAADDSFWQRWSTVPIIDTASKQAEAVNTDSACVVMYQLLGPFDEILFREDMETFDSACHEHSWLQEVSKRAGNVERVFAALERIAPVPGRRLRLLNKRVQLSILDASGS